MRHIIIDVWVFWSTYKKDKTLPTKRTLKTSVSKREKSILTEEWLVAVWKLHSQRFVKLSQNNYDDVCVTSNQPYMEVHRTKSCHERNAKENCSQLAFVYYILPCSNFLRRWLTFLGIMINDGLGNLWQVLKLRAVGSFFRPFLLERKRGYLAIKA